MSFELVAERKNHLPVKDCAYRQV